MRVVTDKRARTRALLAAAKIEPINVEGDAEALADYGDYGEGGDGEIDLWSLTSKTGSSASRRNGDMGYWEYHFASCDFGERDVTFEDYAPAYALGASSAIRLDGTEFNDVDIELSRSWEACRGLSSLDWDQARAAAKHAWDRTRGYA